MNVHGVTGALVRLRSDPSVIVGLNSGAWGGDVPLDAARLVAVPERFLVQILEQPGTDPLHHPQLARRPRAEVGGQRLPLTARANAVEDPSERDASGTRGRPPFGRSCSGGSSSSMRHRKSSGTSKKSLGMDHLEPCPRRG